MKRFFIAFVLLCFIPFGSILYAYEVEYRGLKYEIDTKTMSAFLIKGDKDYNGKLTIPNSIVYNGRNLPVTRIKSHALEKCKFSTLTIPASVEVIESQRTIEYQEGFSVEELIFEDSENALAYHNVGGTFSSPIKYVYIGRSIHTTNKVNNFSGYGNALFEYQPVAWNDKRKLDVEYVKFGNYVRNIPDGLFISCIINKIDFGYGIETIGESFGNCKINDPVLLPESLKELTDYSFLYCEMNTLVLPNSLEKIPNNAFNSSHIKKISLGSNIKVIGNASFWGNDFSTIIIPSTIERIEYKAFDNCPKLRNVVILSNNPNNIYVHDTSFPDETFIDGTLYVPKGTIDKYRNNIFWGRFFNIQEYNETEEPVGFTSIGTGTFTDNFWFERSTTVNIMQNTEDPNIFRIMDPFPGLAKARGTSLDGNQDPYIQVRILQSGETYREVNITRNDLVGYMDICTGYFYTKNESDVYLLHPGRFPKLQSEEAFAYNRVLEWQKNGLPSRIQLAPYYYMFGVGGWNKTADDNIIIITFPRDPAGIKGVTMDSVDTHIYDMQGNRLNNLRKGVNIIREKDGRTRKVIMR